MAINSNINPYGGGNVVFDNRPYLQFYQQQEARRQAKADALDNYFRDLGKNITPSGMRNQDVEGLSKRTNEWRQFYAENKNAITNPRIDNGKAYTEYMSRYQDQLGYIDRSKNRLKVSDELSKTKLDPAKSYILDDPQLMDKLHQHDLPLDEQGSKDLNLMEIATPPKPWTIKDQAAHSAYLTHNLTPDAIPGRTQNLSGYKTITPITKQYSKENLEAIGQRSGSAYDMDRALQFETAKLAKQLENDPARHDQLNSTFKQVYGRDMNDARDVRIAQDLSNEDKRSIEYKQGDDTYNREVALMGMRQKNAKELIDYKKKIDPNDTELNNVWYKSYLDNVMADAKKGGERHHVYNPRTGESQLYYNMIKPDPFLLKSFSVGNSTPERIGVTESGELIPIFYKYDKEGKVVTLKDKKTPALDENFSQPMSYEQALTNMGFRGSTKKQFREDQQKIQTQSKGKNAGNKIEDLRKKYDY
jgi:hypothetical protein